jgi:hypothetical protein
MAVYGSKSEHARAVQALASTLAAASEDSVLSESTQAGSAVPERRTERDEHGEQNVTVQS